MDRFNRPVGGYNPDSVVSPRKIEITVADRRVKVEIFHLESAFVLDSQMISRARAMQAHSGFDIEKDGQFGPVPVAHQIGKPLDKVQRDSPSVSLIRH